MESQVRGLKSLGVESSSYGSLLLSVLLQKLPSELRLVLSRKVSEADWNLDELLKQLEREIEARERAAMSTSQTVKKQGRDPPASASTAAALSSPSTTPNCYYCQQSHFSGECGVVTMPDERKQILRRSGRCYICLRKYHVSKDCRSSNRCRKCGGRHHSSVCSKIAPRNPRKDNPTTNVANHPPVTASPNLSNASLPAGLNPQASSFAPATTTTLCSNDTMAVLLQTARTYVYSPTSPQSMVEVRVLMDGGSQRSYIRSVKKALSLPTVKQQKMLIKTFGSEQEDEQVCDVVRIGIQTIDGNNLELPFFSVPLICEPLSHQPVALCKTTYDHLVHLNLMDCHEGHTEVKVNMLIGSDHY